MNRDKVNIDTEFIDHSWQEMAKLLDKELPVKKKRRRFIWIWMLGIGVLFLSLWSTFQFNTDTELKALPIPIAKKPIAAQKKAASNTTKIPNNPSIVKTIPNKTTPISKQSPNDTRPVIFKRDNLTVTSASASASNGSIAEASNTAFPKEQTTRSTLQKTNSFPSAIQSDQLPQPNFNTTRITNFTKLSAKTIPLLAIQPTVFVVPTIPIKRKSSWNFGLYAEKNYPQFGSFSLGFFSNWSLNRKVSIIAGLGYSNRITKHEIVVNTVATEAETDITLGEPDVETTDIPTNPGSMPTPTMDNSEPNTNGSTANPPNTFANESMTIQYKRFHYFDLPIRIQYRLKPRFSIELGGQVSALYGYRYTLGEASYFNQNLSATTTEITRTSVTNEVITFSPLTFSVLGGFNYQLRPNISAYAGFHYGINTYLQHPTGNKKWQQAQIGVRYRIGK